MKIRDLLEKIDELSETGTVAGAMAPVSKPLGKTKKRQGVYEDEPEMYRDEPKPDSWSQEQWDKLPKMHNEKWVDWKLKQHAKTGEPLELVNASGSRGSLSVGDLRKFGWVEKEYTHYNGEVDGIIWHLSRKLPFPVVVGGQTYQPGESIGDV